jgi:hypothetical protein
MNKPNELPKEISRLLLNLESDSHKVVTDSLDALEKIGDTDPRIVTLLRKRLQNERGEWPIRLRGYVVSLAEKLTRKAEKEDLQRFEDFIMNDEMPDRDLIMRIIRFEMETRRLHKSNLLIFSYSLFVLMMFLSGVIFNH